MNVFVDYHHDDLLNSLHILFEKRLRMSLYRPIGIGWYDEGFWKIAEPYSTPLETATQFLVLDSQPIDGTKPLNTNPKYTTRSHHKLITLEDFKKTKFDIVIASYLSNIPVYKKLISQHQPEAKLIHQMGNDWSKMVDYRLVKNILASTAEFKVPQGVNVVFYHQEFSTKVFRYEPPEYNHRRRISSFIHTIEAYPEDYALLKEYMTEMDDYDFKIYGAGNTSGVIDGDKNIAKEMHDSTFGWHLKKGGDGFGHVIHNWFVCGRPPIVKMEHYKDKLAGKLMEDGVTCIAIDGLTVEQGTKKIRQYATPEKHEKMCKEAHTRFGSVVNFDKEEKDIRKFLDMLK